MEVDRFGYRFGTQKALINAILTTNKAHDEILKALLDKTEGLKTSQDRSNHINQLVAKGFVERIGARPPYKFRVAK